jgi:DNA-binding response OmpR family regulator
VRQRTHKKEVDSRAFDRLKIFPLKKTCAPAQWSLLVMSPLSPLRILVTEDEPDARDLIDTILTLSGCEVITADSLLQTLLLARTNTIDLYLLDNRMSDISGIELCRKLREFDPKTPILFYSGAGEDSDRKEGLAAGAQGYLVKPCEPAKLVSEVFRLAAESQCSDTPPRIEV